VRVEDHGDDFDFSLNLEDVFDDVFPVQAALGLQPSRLKQDLDGLPQTVANHFLWTHHDAKIHGIAFSASDFHLTFNHYDVERLAAILVDYPDDWRALQRAFPVTLQLRDVVELHVLNCVENGVLLKLRHSFRNAADSWEDIYWLHAYPLDRGLWGVAVEMHGNRWFQRRRFRRRESDAQMCGSTLCVATPEIRVELRERDGWSEVFGEESTFVVERFLERWPHDTHRWCVDQIQDWLKTEFAGTEADAIQRARAHGMAWLARRRPASAPSYV
jgi:ribosomal protein L35AE/L33A